MFDKKEMYGLILDIEQGGISAEDALVEMIEMTKDIDKSSPNVFTGHDMDNCPLGLYEVFWKSGGSSVATIGMTYDGTRWIAPSNWCNGKEDGDPTARMPKHRDEIEKIVLLYQQR